MAKLINFHGMWAEYPLGTSDEVKKRIGGAVDADWVTNTCVIRVSRAFNHAGLEIPVKTPGVLTLKGGDGKRYALRVLEFKSYLRSVYGAPQWTHAYAAEGGPVPADLFGKQGIICFDVKGWSDASGHFDLWNGQRCINHGYFERAAAVHLWAVPDGEAPSQDTGQVGARGPLRPQQTISASVGAGGVNRPEDVKLTQGLLAAHGHDPGATDGTVVPATIEAIKAFQRGFASWPDGRVDVNGRTFRELNRL